MLVISFICIYIKGSALIAYSIAIALLCLVELFKTFKLNDILIECTSILFSIVVLYFIGTSNKNLVLTSFSLYFLVVSIYYLFFNKINIVNLGKLIFSFIYITVPMGVFLRLGDTYLLIFGKHKLYPSISPKKTVEGSIGGIIGSLLLLILFNIFVLKYNYTFIIVSGILLSIVAQIGDLFASKIKREIGIKDFSNIIKGHGGFLDRFDSIIFVTPLVYILFSIFGGSI